mmetsp:Transcript_75910/g.191949  ORF Transcript_75910/g.191949 Transcript_75910/m.191949 type:complete len:221 (+) Transcript_75910:819-1481(+)
MRASAPWASSARWSWPRCGTRSARAAAAESSSEQHRGPGSSSGPPPGACSRRATPRSGTSMRSSRRSPCGGRRTFRSFSWRREVARSTRSLWPRCWRTQRHRSSSADRTWCGPPSRRSRSVVWSTFCSGSRPGSCPASRTTPSSTTWGCGFSSWARRAWTWGACGRISWIASRRRSRARKPPPSPWSTPSHSSASARTALGGRRPATRTTRATSGPSVAS